MTEATSSVNTANTAAVPEDPQALAEAVAKSMWARDRAAQAMGMRIDSVGPGRATLSMPVREDMLNGHDICHGGITFALADTAFAYACNAYNFNTVGAGCNIEYLAPGLPGETLTAEAVETHLAGRNGIYDITVRDSKGTVLALFRGKSRRVAGNVIR